MSPLAKNVAQVVYYEKQVSYFGAILCANTPIGSSWNNNRAMCKSGNSPEIVHTCRLTYVEAMLHFSPSYAYLHQSKMAAVGHLGFLTFDRIALESHIIPHF